MSAVIEVAEEAAEGHPRAANLEPIEILRQAEQRAATKIEELTRESSRVKTEADQSARDITEGADSYGTQHQS